MDKCRKNTINSVGVRRDEEYMTQKIEREKKQTKGMEDIGRKGKLKQGHKRKTGGEKT